MPPKPQRHVPQLLFSDFVLICRGFGFIALLHQAWPLGSQKSNIPQTWVGGAPHRRFYSVEGVGPIIILVGLFRVFSVKDKIKSNATTANISTSLALYVVIGIPATAKYL